MTTVTVECSVTRLCVAQLSVSKGNIEYRHTWWSIGEMDYTGCLLGFLTHLVRYTRHLDYAANLVGVLTHQVEYTRQLVNIGIYWAS